MTFDDCCQILKFLPLREQFKYRRVNRQWLTVLPLASSVNLNRLQGGLTPDLSRIHTILSAVGARLRQFLCTASVLGADHSRQEEFTLITILASSCPNLVDLSVTGFSLDVVNILPFKSLAKLSVDELTAADVTVRDGAIHRFRQNANLHSINLTGLSGPDGVDFLIAVKSPLVRSLLCLPDVDLDRARFDQVCDSCPGLSSLELIGPYSSWLRDISPIAKFSQLRELALCCCSFRDDTLKGGLSSVMMSCKHLTSLAFKECVLDDFTFLSFAWSLEQLYVWGVVQFSTAELSKLPPGCPLHTLDLRSCLAVSDSIADVLQARSYDLRCLCLESPLDLSGVITNETIQRILLIHPDLESLSLDGNFHLGLTALHNIHRHAGKALKRVSMVRTKCNAEDFDAFVYKRVEWAVTDEDFGVLQIRHVGGKSAQNSDLLRLARLVHIVPDGEEGDDE